MAIGDKEYNVEFDDSVLSLKGWANPRYVGCNLSSLYYNEYNGKGDNIKLIGTYQNGNLETTQTLKLPETRYATGVTTDSYGWWMNKYRYTNIGSKLFGDPTIGALGQEGHAFADVAFTNGMGPRSATSNITYSGIRYLGAEETFDLAPTLAYGGDDSYSVMPTIQNTTNTIFLGTKVMGNKEDKLYPGPGPDFSYLVINKAITFDPDDDSFFIIENETDDDPTFEKLVQTNLPWASKFRLRLLDDAQPHNLKKNYGVHFNRGLFSLFAKWTAYHNPSKDTVDGNGRWNRSLESKFHARHDFTILSSTAYLVESASNRYQRDFPGTPPSFYKGAVSQSGQVAPLPLSHPTYYGYDVTGSVNAVSGSEGVQLGGAAPVEHTFNPLLRITNTQFEWISRHHATPQSLGRDISVISSTDDGPPNMGPNYKGGEFSGSLIVNRENPVTEWWFKEGGVENITAINPIISQSTDLKNKSFRRLIERIHDQDKLYICTINDAVNVDKAFRVGVEEVFQSAVSESGDNLPFIGQVSHYSGSYLTHANTFGSPLTISGATDSGQGGVKLFKVSKPLVTFGSFPWKGDTVGVPGCSPNRIHWYDIRKEVDNRQEPQIHIPDGYAPQFLDYAQSSTIYARTQTETLNGTDAWAHSWWGSELTAVANQYTATIAKLSNAIQDWQGGTAPGDSHLLSSQSFFSLTEDEQYNMFITASDGGYLDAPFCDNWTISCLEERNNVILSDINKSIELSSGTGKKGFAIISENLNPEIRQNLDYFLKKAELIESGPKTKDRNLIRHKPRPGFFKKRKIKKKKPGY